MILFIRSAAWSFFRVVFFSSAIGLSRGDVVPDPDRIRFIESVQGGADRAGQLRKLGEHDRLTDHLPGHFDDIRVVRDDSPRHDDPAGVGVHLQHSLDDRVEEPLDDVGHLFPVADVLEDLRRRKDGAVASELDHLQGLAGQGVHRLQGDVEAQGHLLEKRPGAGGALPVHLETRPASVPVELDHLVVLAADVDDGDRLVETIAAPPGEAADLGLALRGDEADVGPAVPGRNGVRDLVAAGSGQLQRFIEASRRGGGRIGPGFPDGVSEDLAVGVDHGDLGSRRPDVETDENGRRHGSQRSPHTGGRFSMKAVNPSTASRVAINSSRYSRSTSASLRRTRSTKSNRAARTANRRELALRIARCSSKYARAATLGSSASVFTRPIRCASSAPMLRPEKRRSSARDWPIRSGSRQEAAGANTASLISGCPSIAPGAAKIRWPAAATSRPPPRHWPRTATRTGTGLATS